MLVDWESRKLLSYRYEQYVIADRNHQPLADESCFVYCNHAYVWSLILTVCTLCSYTSRPFSLGFDVGYITILLFQIGGCSSHLIRACTDFCPALCSIEEPCYGLRTLHYALQHFHGYYDSKYLLNKVTFCSVYIFPFVFQQYCLVLYWFKYILYLLHVCLLVYKKISPKFVIVNTHWSVP
jgi:hypothetical protein